MSLATLVLSGVSVLLLLVALYNLRSVKANHGVVVLTGLTSKTLKDFEGVEGFYDKMWNNRVTYATAHGISLRLASHAYKVTTLWWST